MWQNQLASSMCECVCVCEKPKWLCGWEWGQLSHTVPYTHYKKNQYYILRKPVLHFKSSISVALEIICAEAPWCMIVREPSGWNRRAGVGTGCDCGPRCLESH
jgi:hypothetical protein